MFGLFMLVGIVKKNGILQVDKRMSCVAQACSATSVIDANHPAARSDDHDDADCRDDSDRVGQVGAGAGPAWPRSSSAGRC